MAFPGTYNFNYYRGDTAEFVIRPKTANGSAYDLTNYTATFTIANRRGSTGTQYVATATVNATTDIITCTITPAVGYHNLGGAIVTNGIYATISATLDVTIYYEA
jgi:hypothetical protein